MTFRELLDLKEQPQTTVEKVFAHTFCREMGTPVIDEWRKLAEPEPPGSSVSDDLGVERDRGTPDLEVK